MASGISFNDRAGDTQYRACRTVILFKPDYSRRRKITFKAEYVLKFCPPETINTLIIISNYTEVLMIIRKESDQSVLSGVRILIFIHQYISECFLIFITQLLILFK